MIFGACAWKNPNGGERKIRAVETARMQKWTAETAIMQKPAVLLHGEAEY